MEEDAGVVERERERERERKRDLEYRTCSVECGL
jgi:hypothetical protein